MPTKVWEKYFPVSYAVALYGIAALGDWTSSSIGTAFGLLEANPLTRDALFHFSLWRSLIVDGTFFAMIALLSWALYILLKFYSIKLAKFAASVLFTYIGLDRIVNAVIPNTVLILHSLHK